MLVEAASALGLLLSPAWGQNWGSRRFIAAKLGPTFGASWPSACGRPLLAAYAWAPIGRCSGRRRLTFGRPVDRLLVNAPRWRRWVGHVAIGRRRLSSFPFPWTAAPTARTAGVRDDVVAHPCVIHVGAPKAVAPGVGDTLGQGGRTQSSGLCRHHCGPIDRARGTPKGGNTANSRTCTKKSKKTIAIGQCKTCNHIHDINEPDEPDERAE